MLSTATVIQPLDRPEGCRCGSALADVDGNIHLVRSCPICMKKVLDSLNGVEYSSDTQEGVSRLLIQSEFFSLQSMQSSPSSEVGSNGER